MALIHAEIHADHQRDQRGRSDRDLVELARHGDGEAVRALVQRNNRRLFRVARAVLRNDAEAEDVVQETYVKAFTKLDTFRGDAHFSSWLTRIALNESIGRVRARRPTTELAELDLSADAYGGRVIAFPTSLATPGADSDLARKEVRAVLERTIDDLPAALRIVFILRDIEEMSIEETASQLSLRPGTVKTRLHRARRLLRKAIEKHLSSTFSELFPFDGARCTKMAERVLARLPKLNY